jgi:hypothetical protein
VKKERSCKIEILHTTWTFKVVSPEAFKKIAKEYGVQNAAAMASAGNSTAYFTEDKLDKETVGHELFHAIVFSFPTGDAFLNLEQFEEVIANYLGRHVDKFIKMRDLIFNKLKGK